MIANALQMFHMEQFKMRCQEVVHFCQSKGGVCFKDWPGERLLLYTAFHAVHGSISVVRGPAGILAVAFAWPARANDIQTRNAADLSAFDWKTCEKPDCIFVAEVVGNKCTLKKYCAEAKIRWPQVRCFVTFRYDKLVDITRLIERLAP